MNPVVAIVGRPNVKSTLMNRIIGRREAIVEERPGVTRDRKEVEAFWLDRTFTLIDTGGWITGGDSLDEKVSRQSEQSMFNADVVLFVLDSTVGITEEDAQVADLLRKKVESVVVVANKVDDRNHESSAWELMSLGLGEPATISALHGRGTGDLLDRVIELLPEPVEIIEEEGLENRWNRHKEMAFYTREWAKDLGQDFFTENDSFSYTITCIKNIQEWDIEKINQKLLSEGYRMDRGYGKYRYKTFRIPHMGNIYMDDLLEYLKNMDEVLCQLKY